MNLSAVLRLIRFHKPVGTLLLWFPTAWALWLANHQTTPPITLIVFFFLGTFFMRSAGCILNDIADRHVDCHVERTKSRPLTSGEITLPEALTWLILFLCMAFFILLQLPLACFYEALIALAITTLYPFCKRFFQAPQLILGIAFSMGIPMAYTASHTSLNMTTSILFILNFFWIVAYDTLYAMADRVDDLRIGVRSTAILFGRYWQVVIIGLQGIAHGLWLIIAHINALSNTFYLFWFIGVCIFIYQHYMIKHHQADVYLRMFSSHALYGFVMWLALVFHHYSLLD